ADLNEAAGEEIATQLGGTARFTKTDITDSADVQSAIDLARDQFGALHGAIHCAGILAAARIVGKEKPHDLAMFQKVIHVNVVGTFNVLRLAAAAMVDNPPNQDGERG